MVKTTIRLTESELRNIITEELESVLIQEGWFKNAAFGAALGLSSLMPNTMQAQNNNTRGYQSNTNDTVQTTNVSNQKMSIQQLQKLFPQAYKDRNANQQTWQKNQTLYVSTLPNGKQSLVGKIAASHGQNPWNALVDRYGQTENDNTFDFGDFDIR